VSETLSDDPGTGDSRPDGEVERAGGPPEGEVAQSGPPQPTSDAPSADDALEALWSAIRSSWTEEKRHQAFLAYCQERDVLPEAARRYRSVGTDPSTTDERRRLAEQKLKSITALALAKLANEKVTPTGAGMKYVRLAAGLMLAAALLLLGWALAR
jgi:hypothetical protein